MNPTAVLQQWRESPHYRGQIVHVQRLPPQGATYLKPQEPLPARLATALREQGIQELYAHQALALDRVRQGHHVVINTPAASGKTLCYHLPVLEAFLRDRASRALYLFPTKALAQDQLRQLRELVAGGLPELNTATFDGDTPSAERTEIKERAHLVLTNPDMLHVGILPHHRSWSRFLSRLRYVVLDEAHVYRGVFGSHVANVIRRLQRLCTRYGSSPQFIGCSATLGNAQEHAQRLLGLPVELIDRDGAPHGEKDFAFWNPPFLDGAQTARRSPNGEAASLFASLVAQGSRTIAFARTRKLAELIYTYAREQLREQSPGLAQRISPYRAGYLPEERRRIERALFAGELLGVTATTALELGIDIGDLEATILTGYPGSIASTWQQAGRSGRGRGRSLSVLIGQEGPLDQYLMRHPEVFFGKPPECALLDPDNPYLLSQHLLCAAYELPLSPLDAQRFGPRSQECLSTLAQDGLLHQRGGRWYPSATMRYPAQEVHLRSTTPQTYQIVDVSQGPEVLETVAAATAFFLIHPGAVYLHRGESYLITELDLASRTAYAEPVDLPYYTQTKDLTDIRVLRPLQTAQKGTVRAYLGELEVTTTVVAYRKKRLYSEEVLGEEPLDLPPQRMTTVGLWFDIPEGIEAELQARHLDFPGALHAAEHAAIGMLPLFALCDRTDIGGLSTPWHSDTARAQIFIYDGHPGGVGIAERGFQVLEELWQATLKTVQECPCEAGCPSCVQSPKCGNNNEPLDKAGSVLLLKALLGGEGLRVRKGRPEP